MLNLYFFLKVGIVLFGLIRLKRDYPANASIRTINVGIDLSGLIRLKLEILFCRSLYFTESGLICLDWYNWNGISFCRIITSCWGRDWSIWIDTIETIHGPFSPPHFLLVGIDLSRLIRLKPNNEPCYLFWWYSRDWSVWIDTIETFQIWKVVTAC